MCKALPSMSTSSKIRQAHGICVRMLIHTALLQHSPRTFLIAQPLAVQRLARYHRPSVGQLHFARRDLLQVVCLRCSFKAFSTTRSKSYMQLPGRARSDGLIGCLFRDAMPPCYSLRSQMGSICTTAAKKRRSAECGTGVLSSRQHAQHAQVQAANATLLQSTSHDADVVSTKVASIR